jgi:hypothetical protein
MPCKGTKKEVEKAIGKPLISQLANTKFLKTRPRFPSPDSNNMVCTGLPFCNFIPSLAHFADRLKLGMK